MEIEVGRLRRWKETIPLLPHERRCAGKLFLIVSEPRGTSENPQLFVEYLEDQEIHTDFVTWIANWSVSVDETR